MPYAIIVEGDPVEVPADVPFWTSQLKITTPEEAAWSGWPIGSVIDKVYNHGPTALDAYSDEDRARYAIHRFAVPAAPDGKVLESYILAMDGDSVVVTPTFGDPPVPAEVTRVQGRLQLQRDGKLATIETAVQAADAEIQIYWADTAIFRRDNALLNGMWTALNWTGEALDQTFRDAAAIPT